MTPQVETRYARSGEVTIAYQVVGDGPRRPRARARLLSHARMELGAAALRALPAAARLLLAPDRLRQARHRHVRPPWTASRPRGADGRHPRRHGRGRLRARRPPRRLRGRALAVLFAATLPRARRGSRALREPARSSRRATTTPGLVDRAERSSSTCRRPRRTGARREAPQLLAPSLRTTTPSGAGSRRLVRRREPRARALAHADEHRARRPRRAADDPRADARPPPDRATGSSTSRQARYLAEHIPGARLVELPGADHWPVRRRRRGAPRRDRGVPDRARGRLREPDRVLATVLFTDIVGSTERAAELGDRRWRELLEHHHALVRRELDRFRGRELDTTGDGFLATFDGPARAIRCAGGDPRRPSGARPRDPRRHPHRRVRAPSATTSAASRCTSARGSPRWPAPARSSSRAPSTTSSPAPGPLRSPRTCAQGRRAASVSSSPPRWSDGAAAHAHRLAWAVCRLTSPLFASRRSQLLRTPTRCTIGSQVGDRRSSSSLCSRSRP